MRLNVWLLAQLESCRQFLGMSSSCVNASYLFWQSCLHRYLQSVAFHLGKQDKWLFSPALYHYLSISMYCLHLGNEVNAYFFVYHFVCKCLTLQLSHLYLCHWLCNYLQFLLFRSLSLFDSLRLWTLSCRAAYSRGCFWRVVCSCLWAEPQYKWDEYPVYRGVL